MRQHGQQFELDNFFKSKGVTANTTAKSQLFVLVKIPNPIIFQKQSFVYPFSFTKLTLAIKYIETFIGH